MARGEYVLQWGERRLISPGEGGHDERTCSRRSRGGIQESHNGQEGRQVSRVSMKPLVCRLTALKSSMAGESDGTAKREAMLDTGQPSYHQHQQDELVERGRQRWIKNPPAAALE